MTTEQIAIAFFQSEQPIKCCPKLTAHVPVIERRSQNNSPKVEYSLTEKGKSLIPILDQMCDWGSAHRGNSCSSR